MSIEFISAGLQTSLQDEGWVGLMHQGISQSGAMDAISMYQANWLVSKPLNSAVLEITLMGPTLKFHQNLTLAVCGARFELFLNDQQISMDETLKVNEGDILRFGQLKQGARAYMSFSAELELEPVFNRFSTHLTAGFGGFKGRSLQKNDRLKVKQVFEPARKKLAKEMIPAFSGHYLLRTVPAVETKQFTPGQLHDFYSQHFQVSTQSNRMGIRLQGGFFDKIHENRDNNSMISSGLLPGSIQIPPSGTPIISAVDGQTIGGYPRIAQVIAADVPLLGQLKAQDKVSFCQIDRAHAVNLLKQKKKLIGDLQ
ncbi:MAG TPA: biotin-dependent carboxyltransferase [Aeromonadales bacterium]|nr:biotin-dependent carboxyltransferase [Aeromonadales bacterium]